MKQQFLVGLFLLVFVLSAQAQSRSSAPPLKTYKVEILSMRCIEEDDPGGEIEIFGKMNIKVRYSGRNRRIRRISNYQVWSRSERRPFEMDEMETYRGIGSTSFRVSEREFNAGKIRLYFSANLWEHDGSSGHDKMELDNKIGDERNWNWRISDRLNRTKKVLITEGDTILEVIWRVTK